MKLTARLILIVATVACLNLVRSARADDNWNGLYVRFDAGGTVVQDTELREFFGPVTPGAKVKFDPGFRLGLDFGYNIADWVAVEGEIGMLYNSIKEIEGAWHTDASLVNMPVMVNLRFQLPNKTRFKPFIGVGVGGMESLLDLNDVSYSNYGSPLIRHVSGNASDFVFACQGFAGLRFAVNDRLGVSVEYRYMHTSEPDYDTDWGTFYYVYTTHAKFGTLDAHMLSAAVDYQF